NARLRDPGDGGPRSTPGSTCPYAGCDPWPDGERLLPRNSTQARKAMACLYKDRSVSISGQQILCTGTPAPVKKLMATRPVPACISELKTPGCDLNAPGL